MLSSLRKISKIQLVAILIDSLLLISTMVMYFLYTEFDLFGFGISFLIIGFIQIIFRTCYVLRKKNFSKMLWLCKDFVLIVFTAFIASLIILITNSYSLEYNSYIIFNVLFILFISFQISFDLITGDRNG